ncbi:MAG: efflux RND transporter permease subunit [Alphaproteobacteria bacterium]|nr:efflux RND transporter permease subunit [Alphaproteobacteria bacterium]
MSAVIFAALDRARAVFLILILLLIIGGISFLSIPKESQPDIDIPILLVNVSHPGISPDDAERLLLPPLEKRLMTVEGMKKITSIAGEGFAHLTLEFDAGFDADTAIVDVRTQIDIAKRDLPADANDPTVTEINVGLFPVVVVALYGAVPEQTLVAVAKRLKDEIERLPQVLQVSVAGDREEMIEIIANPTLMQSYNVAPAAVLGTVAQNNRVIAAGALQDDRGRFPVTVPGLIRTAQDLFGLPVKVNNDTVVTLGDIATVRRTFKDRSSYARFNGEPAVMLQVTKRLGENIIETVDGARAIVDAAQKLDIWPAGVRAELIQDQSKETRDLLGEFQNHVAIAVVLVMIVIIAALGLRGAALVGIAIPGSFLFAILALQSFGLTLNFVVLFSLILAASRVIDGSIVVTEYADRKMAEGLSKRDAYGLAATRMSWPIITSYAATIAAFSPLLFWPGIVGEFMKFLPIVMIATLVGSLIMAMIFVPALGSWFGRAAVGSEHELKALAAAESGDLSDVRGLARAYVWAMRHILRFPSLVLAGAVAILVGVFMLYGTYGKGIEFFPTVESESAAVLVQARGNLSIDEKDRLVREVENIVLRIDGVESVFTTVGGGGGGAGEAMGGGGGGADTIGTIRVDFLDWDKRRKARAILDDIVAQTKDIAGINVRFQEASFGPPTGKAVQMEITSIDPTLIAPAVEIARKKLESMPGLINIEDTRPVPGIEWQVIVDRTQAGVFGADITTIGNMVKLVTTGIKVSSYRPADTDDEIDIIVRYPAEYRTLSQLDQLTIQTAKGNVPVGSFVRRTPAPQVGSITRVDGHRVLSVSSGVAAGVLPADIVTELKAWISAGGLPEGISVKFGGEDVELQESQAFLTQAFLVAMFLIAMTMLIQFNSFYQTFIVLSAVVMSTIGVLAGLMIAGQPFGVVMSGIGVIALAGVVVDNNIVLIQTYNYLRERYEPLDAILRTGAMRLRPVLLTAGVTVLGLTPTMYGINIDIVHRHIEIGAPGTALWTQLSLAIVAGLSFATLLTLVVTPGLLALGANVSAWRSRRSERRTGRAAGDPVRREEALPNASAAE